MVRKLTQIIDMMGISFQNWIKSGHIVHFTRFSLFKAASADQISEMLPHFRPYILSLTVHHVYYLLIFSPCLLFESKEYATEDPYVCTFQVLREELWRRVPLAHPQEADRRVWPYSWSESTWHRQSGSCWIWRAFSYFDLVVSFSDDETSRVNGRVFAESP